MDSHVAVTLFRHGVTTGNLEKRYMGWSDAPLTHEAEYALEALKSNLPSYDFCVTSDLSRCSQTAAILCPDLQHVESQAFREMNFGQWEQKTYEELYHDAVYQNWLSDPFSIRPPRGESFAEMERRVMEGWQSLKQAIDERGHREILLVIHGGVIRLLLTKLAKEVKRFWQWKIPHSSGIRLCWNGCGWKEDARCTSLQVVPSTGNENG
ncbi:histidine phosphatase family protein [Lentibacillus cibarius]|uniref:Histidine phosphatase family protein n=1 Tax=Lentibacillus cibarius TaxID=2583219 RepID=A0A549YJQ7_9BACI|nr:histidine phosphatase family protein [Lentibacillus cibarius]TRM12092.1 histidine phosphatase family protein [Lentibacillus cibarius]